MFEVDYVSHEGETHLRGNQLNIKNKNADLAHLVERDLAKVEVAGSSPVIRSNFNIAVWLE